MAKVTQNAHISMAPVDLWALMCDLEQRPRWDPSVNQLRREPLPGSTRSALLHYTAPLTLGITWTWTGEYISFLPPKQSAVRMLGGSALRPFKTLAGSWSLKPDGSGTSVQITVNFEPRFRLLEKFMAQRVAKLTAESLRRLSVLASQFDHTER